MKALITGATGCLGRNLATRLLREGWEVHVTGRNESIGALLENQGGRFYKADLGNKEAITALCQGKDVIFHCGALSSPWGKYSDFYRANVLGTNNVIEGCLKHDVKRLVHVSTPSIYFDFKEKHQISEADLLPEKPVNHYAATKHEAEHFIDAAFKEHNLPVITIRPRAIFGPYDTAIMPRIIRAARNGKVPHINGGNALIDATYVDNVVESLLLCASAHEAALGKKYNITNGEPIQLKDLLRLSFSALGLPFQPKYISYKTAYRMATIMEAVASLPGISWEPVLTKYGVGVFSIGQTLDISAAIRDLGYKPIITLDQGIRRFAAWWKEKHHAA
ncbi:MAG: NAD-dependent epimerase/dehydratase family protein [Candidatus Jidaibacter sp.]|jgi:nucleoside-diphosphate-sugar epimerase|nr:NAD-dependent epimerase/dehydratase family protein [Candidatus Jidaibacter sp.]